MDALRELIGFSPMTLSASSGNVDHGNGRLRIRCGLNVVTVVTVSAHGRAGIATGNGLRMNAFSI